MSRRAEQLGLVRRLLAGHMHILSKQIPDPVCKDDAADLQDKHLMLEEFDNELATELFDLEANENGKDDSD